MRHAARRARQRGLTLLEIMVALFIALFLLGGLLMMEQNVRGAQQSQTGLTQLQDQERLAMSLLTDVVQTAGYFPNPALYSASATYFPLFTASGSNNSIQLQPGQMIAGLTVSNVVTTPAGTSETLPSDTIAVRFMTSGTDNLINCTGNVSAGATTFVNVFSVNPATQQLQCSSDGSSTPSPIVNGVLQLSALYGVSTSPATPSNVDTYLTASQISAAGLWNSILTVKVTVVFWNPLYAQPGAPQTVSISRVIDLQNQTGINTT